MSILGKLKFWEHNDELGLGKDFPSSGGGFPNDELGLQSPGLPDQPGIGQQEARGYRSYTQQPYGNRDLELVSAKLDALRATLDSINQRLANIERIAYGEEEESKRRGW